MRLRTASVPLLLALGTALAGCAADTDPAASPATTTDPASEQTGDAAVLARAELVDPQGATHGTVTFTEDGAGLQVSVEATGLSPGFHGLHVHSIGQCEPDSPDPTDPSNTADFLSSGGHLAAEAGASHPDHAGDLPVLQVDADGQARLTTFTDRLTEDLLLDDDGSAVIVHDGPDNYANIPDRYAADGADEETGKAGDAGSRVLCGVVEAP